MASMAGLPQFVSNIATMANEIGLQTFYTCFGEISSSWLVSSTRHQTNSGINLSLDKFRLQTRKRRAVSYLVQYQKANSYPHVQPSQTLSSR